MVYDLQLSLLEIKKDYNGLFIQVSVKPLTLVGMTNFLRAEYNLICICFFLWIFMAYNKPAEQ